MSFDLPLADFTGLVERAHIEQIVLSGDPNNVYVDNVYFYAEEGGGDPTEPPAAAPLPTKYRIYFGEALYFDGDPDDEDAVIGGGRIDQPAAA